MREIQIRKYVESDADEVLNVIHRNSIEINSKDYGLELMQQFVSICDVNWLRKRESFSHMYVVVENEQTTFCLFDVSFDDKKFYEKEFSG